MKHRLVLVMVSTVVHSHSGESMATYALTRRSWMCAVGASLPAALNCGQKAEAAEESDIIAEAIFSAGDNRYFQPAFEAARYLGVKQTTTGTMNKGDRDIAALLVQYDKSKVSYKQLLGIFFRNCDPTRPVEEGQFTDRSSSFGAYIWTKTSMEEVAAKEGEIRLQQSRLFKGRQVVAEIRQLNGWTFIPEAETEQRWSITHKNAYEQGLKATGRAKWFEETYKPIKTTACEGSVCGYVYFPCSDENGCTAVMRGSW